MSETYVIRQAFLEALSILGERAARAIVEDLRRYGVFLYDQDLSLERLTKGLREMVGEETTQLLLERVFIRLDELYSSRRYNH